MNFLKNLFKTKPLPQVLSKESEVLPAETPKEAKQKAQLQALRVKATLIKSIPLQTPQGQVNLEIGTEIWVDPEKHIGQYSFYDFGMKKEEYKILYMN